MTIITIVGSGMMGTALCWPLAENHHIIRLVGTPLDEEIIRNIRQGGIHPRLKRAVPGTVQPYSYRHLEEALEGAEVIVNGVSSFGIPWFTETVGSLLRPEIPVLSVTKGLVDLPNGELQILPDYVNEHLPKALKGRISLNAIGGPCTALELAARRQTCVVFCGRDNAILSRLRQIFSCSYYHIWLSTDVTGVEVCAALKNAYALGVSMIWGIFDKEGPDGSALMTNPQAAVFAQSCVEMQRFLEITGGGIENTSWLPGCGDLYVTIYGGRTQKLGRLIGSGLTYQEARQKLTDETLESVEITNRIGRALPRLEARGIVQPEDFPLLRHIYNVINTGESVNIPWEKLF